MAGAAEGEMMAEPVRLTTKRKQRPQLSNRYRRSATADVTSAQPSPEELYRVLIMAAEGYVQFNQL